MQQKLFSPLQIPRICPIIGPISSLSPALTIYRLFSDCQTWNLVKKTNIIWLIYWCPHQKSSIIMTLLFSFEVILYLWFPHVLLMHTQWKDCSSIYMYCNFIGIALFKTVQYITRIVVYCKPKRPKSHVNEKKSTVNHKVVRKTNFVFKALDMHFICMFSFIHSSKSAMCLTIVCIFLLSMSHVKTWSRLQLQQLFRNVWGVVLVQWLLSAKLGKDVNCNFNKRTIVKDKPSQKAITPTFDETDKVFWLKPLLHPLSKCDLYPDTLSRWGETHAHGSCKCVIIGMWSNCIVASVCR